MTIKTINEPLFEYGCDFCKTTVKSRWTPPHWEIVSIAILDGKTSAQIMICQECLKRPILELVNKVTVNE